MELKIATIGDAKLLFDWANDVEVRQMALNQREISWEQHIDWFQRKLNDSRTFIYIAYDQAEPVGQIRFDLDEFGDAEVDVHIRPGSRARGFGTLLIKLGVNKMRAKIELNEIHAHIKQHNVKSIKAFEKAGFLFRGMLEENNISCVHLVNKRSVQRNL